jgi:hypothetical protein
MPKPQGKSNLIHQQILASLLDNRRGTLANNVSELSVNRAAKRWAK